MWQDLRIGGAARTYALATSLLAIGLALPAAAAATPVPVSVTKNVEVKSSGTTSTIARCPGRQAVALAGAVVSNTAGAVPRDSLPRDVRSWTFRFTTLAGASSRRARVVLRCARLRMTQGMDDVRLRVSTATRPVTTPALSSRRVRVTCTRGFLPAGYGLDRSFRGSGGPLPAADLRLASAIPSTGSWVFRLENSGGSDTRTTIYLRCISRTATARRANTRLRQSLVLRRSAFSDSVGRGNSEDVAHNCPRNHFSLGLGHALRARDDIFARSAYPAATRAGRWSFDHQTGASERVRTYLTCLSLGTSFR